ncbi:MAG: hypothetical protein Q4D90_05325 [bacterium]|nr:hypothetical protein [bacterium]
MRELTVQQYYQYLNPDNTAEDKRRMSHEFVMEMIGSDSKTLPSNLQTLSAEDLKQQPLIQFLESLRVNGKRMFETPTTAENYYERVENAFDQIAEGVTKPEATKVPYIQQPDGTCEAITADISSPFAIPKKPAWYKRMFSAIFPSWRREVNAYDRAVRAEQTRIQLDKQTATLRERAENRTIQAATAETFHVLSKEASLTKDMFGMTLDQTNDLYVHARNTEAQQQTPTRGTAPNNPAPQAQNQPHSQSATPNNPASQAQSQPHSQSAAPNNPAPQAQSQPHSQSAAPNNPAPQVQNQTPPPETAPAENKNTNTNETSEKNQTNEADIDEKYGFLNVGRADVPVGFVLGMMMAEERMSFDEALNADPEKKRFYGEKFNMLNAQFTSLDEGLHKFQRLEGESDDAFAERFASFKQERMDIYKKEIAPVFAGVLAAFSSESIKPVDINDPKSIREVGIRNQLLQSMGQGIRQMFDMGIGTFRTNDALHLEYATITASVIREEGEIAKKQDEATLIPIEKAVRAFVSGPEQEELGNRIMKKIEKDGTLSKLHLSPEETQKMKLDMGALGHSLRSMDLILRASKMTSLEYQNKSYNSIIEGELMSKTEESQFGMSTMENSISTMMGQRELPKNLRELNYRPFYENTAVRIAADNLARSNFDLSMDQNLLQTIIPAVKNGGVPQTLNKIEQPELKQLLTEAQQRSAANHRKKLSFKDLGAENTAQKASKPERNRQNTQVLQKPPKTHNGPSK